MKFKTRYSLIASGNAAKRSVSGGCNNSTSNLYCTMYNLGLIYNYFVTSLDDINERGTFRNAINTINVIPFNESLFFLLHF